MPEWRLYARDIANQRQAEIKVYRSFKCRSVWNGPGSWALDMPYEAGLFGVLPFRSGVILTRDGVAVFSGVVRSISRQVVGGRTDDWLVGGVDDTARLEDVRCLPVPGGPPYTSAAYDEQTGAAETVMRHYVAANCAFSARLDRRITGLLTTVHVGGLGLTVTERVRFDPLGDVLRRLAVKGVAAGADPLWFRILQDTVVPAFIDFLVSMPVDRSRDVVFSFDRRNLISYEEQEDVPREGNYGYGGGKGELEQQLIREWGEPHGIDRYGRIEAWVNQTQLDDTAEIDAAIVAGLEKSKPRSAVSLVVRDTASAEAFVHYGISDRVTVVRDGVAATGLVREMAVEITPEQGAVVSPFITLDGGVS